MLAINALNVFQNINRFRAQRDGEASAELAVFRLRRSVALPVPIHTPCSNSPYLFQCLDWAELMKAGCLGWYRAHGRGLDYLVTNSQRLARIENSAGKNPVSV
jgi:hypothetical protein